MKRLAVESNTENAFSLCIYPAFLPFENALLLLHLIISSLLLAFLHLLITSNTKSKHSYFARMGESRGSIAFFTSYRPPVALDIFCCPVPPSSKQDELHLTDGLSYNYNCRPIPPAALKTIIKRLRLAPEAVIDDDVDSGHLTGLVFVSEREHSLETLHVALRFVANNEVKIFSLADIYGSDLFSGARLEDNGCIAGGYEVDGSTNDHYLVYVSTKEPVQERRSPWNVVYKTNLRTSETEHLTPPGQVTDLSLEAFCCLIHLLQSYLWLDE